MKSVHIEFKYEKGEYIKAVQTYLFAEGTVSLFDFIVFPMILILDIIYMIRYEINWLSILVLSVNAFVLAMLVMIFWISARISWDTITGIKEDHIITFWEEELHCFSKSQNSHIKWETYKGLLESKEYYFLISEKGKYMVIPKRVFGKFENQLTFEKLASKHVQRVT